MKDDHTFNSKLFSFPLAFRKIVVSPMKEEECRIFIPLERADDFSRFCFLKIFSMLYLVGKRFNGLIDRGRLIEFWPRKNGFKTRRL